jgi:DNA-binding transcriptional LysR family regulator
LLSETEGSLKSSATAAGKLKVIIAGIHQPRFQVAILTGFSTKYPNITLEVTFAERRPNLLEEDFDVAVVLGDLDNEQLNSERIVTFPNCICAHPDYIRENGMPLSPFDLVNFNCIVGSSDKWQFMTDQGEQIAIEVKGTWHTSNGETLLQAARYGVGLAQVPEFYAEPYIESGKLVKVLPHWKQVGQSIWIVLPNRRHVSSKVKVFRDYIKERSVLLTLENKRNEKETVTLFHNMEVKLVTSGYPIMPEIEDRE